MEPYQALNAVYQPIYEYTKLFLIELKAWGYEYTWQFFNNHSVRKNNGWITAYYPIPVISVKNVCDIGLDIDRTFIECKIKREEAIKFDWTVFLNNSFEVYGVKEYLTDFYNASLSLEALAQNISRSNEQEIAIAFEFGYLEEKSTLLKFIKKLSNLPIYP